MEQKIILHFFHLIALHVFLNCYGKIYHFENICVHNNQKRSSETQLSRQNLDLKLSFTTFLWFYNKKPPEQLNMAKNLGHSQEKDWLENSYVVWIYENCSFFPYAKRTVPQCTWWLHTESLYSTRDIFISCANGILSELGTFYFWISGLMLDPLFISRLNNACSLLVIKSPD